MQSRASRRLDGENWDWKLGRLQDGSDEALIRRLFHRRLGAPKGAAKRAATRRQLHVNVAAAHLRESPPPPPKKSGRVGQVNGHPTRTCFIRIVVAERAGPLLRYTHRLNGRREEELESRGGIPAAEFERYALQREDALYGRRRAAVYSIVIELPYETDAPTRAAIMAAIAERFDTFGTTWAVHWSNARGELQPHGHLMILAGPDGERPIDGSEMTKEFRAFVAQTINTVAQQRAGQRLPREWHGGTLADTGIARPPKPDIPHGLYRAWQRREERLRRGKHVTKRLEQLAAARDRIVQHYETAVAEGREPEPQGLARRRARRVEREAMIEELARTQRRAQEMEAELEDVDRSARAANAQRATERAVIAQTIEDVGQALTSTRAALNTAAAERDEAVRRLAIADALVDHAHDATSVAVADLSRRAEARQAERDEALRRLSFADALLEHRHATTGVAIADLSQSLEEHRAESASLVAENSKLRNVTIPILQQQLSCIPPLLQRAHNVARLEDALKEAERRQHVAEVALEHLMAAQPAEPDPARLIPVPEGKTPQGGWVVVPATTAGKLKGARNREDDLLSSLMKSQRRERDLTERLETLEARLRLLSPQQGDPGTGKAMPSPLGSQDVQSSPASAKTLPAISPPTELRPKADISGLPELPDLQNITAPDAPMSTATEPMLRPSPDPAKAASSGATVSANSRPSALSATNMTQANTPSATPYPETAISRPPPSPLTPAASAPPAPQPGIAQTGGTATQQPPRRKPLGLSPRALDADRKKVQGIVAAMDDETLRIQALLQVRSEEVLRRKALTSRDLQIIELLRGGLVEVRRELKRRGLSDHSIEVENNLRKSLQTTKKAKYNTPEM